MSRVRTDASAILSGWLPLAVVPVAAWAVAARIDAATRSIDFPALVAGRFVPSASATVPPDDGAWVETRLPDLWTEKRSNVVEGWYRFSFRADPERETSWAVYLPTLRMNAAVYVNGRLVGDGGRFADPVARHWASPLFFELPGRFLVAGENRLDVRLKADHPGRGLLGPLYVGRESLLRPAFTRRHFFRVDLVAAIALTQGVLIFFTFAVWIGRRHDTLYGWFALAGAALVMTWTDLLVTEIPIAQEAWEWIWYSAIGWGALLLARVAIAFTGDPDPWVNRAFLAIGISGSAGTGWLALTDSPWLTTFVTCLWLPLTLPVILYAQRRVSATLRRDPRDVELLVVYVTGLAAIGCGVRDGLLLAGFLGPIDGLYTPYAAPPAQLGNGWLLLRRLVGALRRSETAVAEFDRRIREVQRELAQSHERAREIDRQRVVADERERLIREMHDGIGAHLVSTLAMLDQPERNPDGLGAAVRAALDDLRATMESIDPGEGDLITALAMLRSRFQPRLEAAGIRVHWEVGDVEQIPGCGPAKASQIVRIAQEAIANVLKHAGATVLTVRIGRERAPDGGDCVCVEVRDDGRGIAEAAARGRGINHIRHRAAGIGATVEILSSPEGTRVKLLLPVSGLGAAAGNPTSVVVGPGGIA